MAKKKAITKRPVKRAATKRTRAARAPQLAVRKFRFNGGFPTAPDLSHVEFREDGAARLVRKKDPEGAQWIPPPALDAEGNPTEPDQRPYTLEQAERHVVTGHWEEL